jgi:hypothetical protein
MQKIIIEDITDYEKLQAWVDTLDPKMKEEYEGKKEEN